MRGLPLAVAVGVALCAATANAQVRNVPTDHPTIQAAIDASAPSGDSVVVAPGTYAETLDFGGRSLVLESSGGAGVTTLMSGGFFAGSVPIVRMGILTEAPTPQVELRGFTITGATNWPPVVVNRANGVIENNVIRGNRTCGTAALELGNARAIVVRNNAIVLNQAANCSGTIGTVLAATLGATLYENLIADNNSHVGGGVLLMNGNTTLRSNVIAYNSSLGRGGGLALEGGDHVVSGNLLLNNRAGNTGGGISAWSASGALVNNTLVDNVAPVGGSMSVEAFGPQPIQAINNIVEGVGESLVHCTTGLGAAAPIFDSNNLRHLSGLGALGTGDCSDVVLETTSTVGDPGFASPTVGDYHLGPASPLLDAGADASLATIDVDGDTRPVDGPDADLLDQYDVGADEGDAGSTGPQTQLTSGPGGVNQTESDATFAFSSASQGLTGFECELDMMGFIPCTSPVTYTGLARHTHVFRVRAVAGAVVERSPAMRIWRTGDCTILGTNFDDVLPGGPGVDRICGMHGDDVLRGDAGSDSLTGAEGVDILDGGAGPDQIDGGFAQFPFADTIDYSSRITPVTVNLSDAAPDGGIEDGVGDSLAGIGDIWGGRAADILTGDATDNLIFGGLGGDQMRGGIGFDVVDYSDATTPVTADIDGVLGDDGRAGEGDSIGTAVEGIIGGDSNDVLNGDADANVLDGWIGNDRLDGRGGPDTIFAGPGDDVVVARDGVVDVVDCEEGIDNVFVDATDTLLDCEQVVFGLPPVAPQPPPPPTAVGPGPPPVLPRGVVSFDRASPGAGGIITVRLKCPTSSRGCEGRIRAIHIKTVRGKRVVVALGSKSYSVLPGTTAKGIRINAAGRRLLATKGRLNVRVIVEALPDARTTYSRVGFRTVTLVSSRAQMQLAKASERVRANVHVRMERNRRIAGVTR